MDRLNNIQNMPSIPDNGEVAEIGVSDYIAAATSDNTRTAYQSDIRHFLKEGGVLPATPEIIQSYLIQELLCNCFLFFHNLIQKHRILSFSQELLFLHHFLLHQELQVFS